MTNVKRVLYNDQLVNIQQITKSLIAANEIFPNRDTDGMMNTQKEIIE